MPCTNKKLGPRDSAGALGRSVRSLAAAPDIRVHPLRMLLLHKGVSIADGARLLGWSLRKLMLVIHEWRRPRDAEHVAKQLGVSVSEIFPLK